MSILSMVEAGHVVVFDKARAFAVHKATGRQRDFQRHGGGWDMILDLEAPELANEEAADMQAEEAQRQGPFLEIGPDQEAVAIRFGSAPEATAGVAERDEPRQVPGPFGRR